MTKYIVSLLLTACSFFVLCFTASASEPDETINRIQKAYAGISDAKGGFVQKSFLKDFKRTDTYKGLFYLKAKKMKWEYHGKNPQTVFINSDEIIIYQKNEKQALRGRFDKASYGQAPIALLAGFGDIRKEFEVSQSGERRLLLKPKKPMGAIAFVELLVGDGEFPIEGLVITDKHSNKTDIRLYDITMNSGIKDKTFDFSPAEGVNIIDR
ncbi:MAG: outer membrane lipoprotein carrier protein LolA [Nitrospirae bacterium]|nr:MAG: outer membrane lipoprotein carrier protein LolA [Nitrospirota bacterium]